jgi:copper chaperone CopZ
MEILDLKLPAMYGDHHVTEVIRLLSETKGVGEIYASSCFQTVEIQYDPSATNPQTITAVLESAGYLGELAIPVETGAAFEGTNGSKGSFRHSIAYEQAGKTVSFAQQVAYEGRPLWPCPGFGAVKSTEEEEHA